MILAILGPAGAGKSTVAKACVQYLREAGYCLATTVSFAQPMRDMLMVLLVDWYGINPSRALWYLHDPVGKETAIPEIGKTSRYLLRTLGTQWGRLLVNEDLWVGGVTTKYAQYCEQDSSFVMVNDDLRFENEATMVRRFGMLVHVTAPWVEGYSNEHESERGVKAAEGDYAMANTKDKDLFDDRVKDVVNELISRAKR